MATYWSQFQPGVIAQPGSDLYNQRVAYNQQVARKAGLNVAGGIPVGAGGPNTGLASMVNPFMAGQAAQQYQLNLPDYQNLITQQSKNILSELRGEVPQDVINQIVTQAAERGIMTGAPGGGAANSSYLRALGLTSLGMQDKGAEDLSRVRADTPVAELWNPMSLYVPQTLAQQELDAAKSGATGGRRQGDMGANWFRDVVGGPGPITSRYTSPSGSFL